MNRLFWFNPENDLALAANTANYTPPAAALALRQAGVMLPSLWSDSSDYIFNAQDTSKIPNPMLIPEPWGWSVYTRNILLRAGIPASALPSDSQLHQIRMLSHRRNTIEVLRLLDHYDTMLPVEASTLMDAYKAIDSMRGDAVVKLPWSCSGRGVFYSRAMGMQQLESVIKGGIKRQRSVMVEPRLDRLTDFAMLFYADNGNITYRGLSLFETDRSGNYSGNIIAPQRILQEKLELDHDSLSEKLQLALTRLTGGSYKGWIGVDMMKYLDPDGRTKIYPCTEINFRMTMGVAALLAAQSGRLPWDTGLLRVALAGIILTPIR